MSIRQIATRLGVARDTVARAVALEGPPSYSRPAVPSAFDPFEVRVRELLAEFPSMSATVIAERVGWDGSPSWFRKKIALLRPEFEPKDPADRLSYSAGDQAQCDLWFPATPVMTPTGPVVFPVLVIVASYPRFITARMVPSRTTQDLLAGMWYLLAEQLGAVPLSRTPPLQKWPARFPDERTSPWLSTRTALTTSSRATPTWPRNCGSSRSSDLIAECAVGQDFVPFPFDKPTRTAVFSPSAKPSAPSSRAGAWLHAGPREVGAKLTRPCVAGLTTRRTLPQVAESQFDLGRASSRRLPSKETASGDSAVRRRTLSACRCLPTNTERHSHTPPRTPPIG